MSGAWWVEAFRADYLDLYPHRDLESARAEARFLAAHGLAGRVLDVCCGWGRHLLAFAELGLDVAGVDWSADLLARVAAQPGGERVAARVVRGDARALPFRDGAFDGAVSLFSSFGYFGEAGDAALLRGVARVLRPGGRAFLDLMNPAYVRARLVPESRREQGGAVLTERRELRGPCVAKEVELLRADGSRRTWREEVRLYQPGEVAELLTTAGLALEAAWGGFDGAPAGPDAPRQLLRATRRRG
jgi:SAM-dependent methyltransferase